MTESGRLARLEFFGSEPKPRGELEGGRDLRVKGGLMVRGSNFEYYKHFKEELSVGFTSIFVIGPTAVVDGKCASSAIGVLAKLHRKGRVRGGT